MKQEMTVEQARENLYAAIDGKMDAEVIVGLSLGLDARMSASFKRLNDQALLGRETAGAGPGSKPAESA